jgi:hypothetical protein
MKPNKTRRAAVKLVPRKVHREVMSSRQIQPQQKKVIDASIQSVTLYVTDCPKCTMYKDRHECERYLELKELIDAIRRDAVSHAYSFKIIRNAEKPYTIGNDKTMKISVESIEINDDGIQKENWQKLLYQVIQYKDGTKRLIIIDEINVK